METFAFSFIFLGICNSKVPTGYINISQSVQRIAAIPMKLSSKHMVLISVAKKSPGRADDTTLTIK